MLLMVLSSITLPTPSHAQFDGCQLGAWIMQQQPHSTRTPEIPAQLSEHSIVINDTARKVFYPAGFKLSTFAKIPAARGLTLSPDGVIYVTSYANGGRVYALPDHNHDGVPDSTIVVASGLGMPHGIGFYNGELYVSNATNFYLMIDANGDRVVESKVSLLSFPSGGHITRNFVFDTVRNKVYIQVGSLGNMNSATDTNRAIVIEANPDGTGRRIYARGLRNAVGMDIDPRTGVLWVNNNGMDNLFGEGDPRSHDNPSESIYMLCDGAHYGWPWTYGFQMRNPTPPYSNLDTAIIQTFNGPVAEILAHSAPLGLHFYRGNALPPIYRNAIFQTYHGSWNRTPPAPPRVTVMWVDSNGMNAQVTDLINGFQPDSTGYRYGRVVSIIEGADSALYISDDAAGYVYKFSWEDSATASLMINEQNLAGQTFAPNAQVAISWTSSMVDSVDIFFASDGITWMPVARSGGNSYLWTVPNTPTTTGRLRLVAVGDTLTSQMVGTFTIASSSEPSLAINEQNLAGQTFAPNAQVGISWTSNMVDSVDIFFTADGITWMSVARSGGNTYLWTVPNTPTTTGRLKLVAVGDTTLTSQMVGTFTIASSAEPSLAINELNLAGQTFAPDSQVTITWTSNLVDSVDIFFAADGINFMFVARSGGNSYLWTVPNTPTTMGRLRLVAVGDTLSSEMVGTFSIVAAAVYGNYNTDRGLQEISINPNPSVNATTVLRYDLKTTEDISIELVDIRGARVWRIVQKGKASGGHAYELDMRDLTPGTYTILVSDSRIIRTAKVSVVR